MNGNRPHHADECCDILVTTQSAKRFLGFQESGSCPAHGLGNIAIVCDSATHTSDHRVRGFDHVGGRQAARQLPGHAKPVDREQLLQSFKQATSRIRMLRMQMLGMGFEFLDTGVGIEVAPGIRTAG